jgi:hypothetical protein
MHRQQGAVPHRMQIHDEMKAVEIESDLFCQRSDSFKRCTSLHSLPSSLFCAPIHLTLPQLRPRHGPHRDLPKCAKRTINGVKSIECGLGPDAEAAQVAARRKLQAQTLNQHGNAVSKHPPKQPLVPFLSRKDLIAAAASK